MGPLLNTTEYPQHVYSFMFKLLLLYVKVIFWSLTFFFFWVKQKSEETFKPCGKGNQCGNTSKKVGKFTSATLLFSFAK